MYERRYRALAKTDSEQIHWPVNFAVVHDDKNADEIQLEPQQENLMRLDESLSLVDTWKALIELQKSGKARSIGVSNFRPPTIQKLIDSTGVVPAVNQGEIFTTL